MGGDILSGKVPESICILRLSALGDVIHTIPVIRAIQAQWPKCKITWICGSFEYKLLRLIDNVEFIVFDKKQGIKAYSKLKQDLGGKRFDILLHMQVAARANIASLMVSANLRIGWDRARSRDFHHWFVSHSVEQVSMQHQQDGFLSFARKIGIDATRPEWRLPITDNARHFADQYLDNDKPVMVISACSSHALRNWTAEGYAAVADYAVTQHGFQVVLSGGPSAVELAMAEKIESCMQQSALNLVGKDTLEQLLGLLSRADVVISPDSGPAHIANALGVPVIGLYACTWSRRSGPYDSLTYCVDKFELAAEKFLQKPANTLFWGTKIEKPGVMELISVDDVIKKLEKVLEDQALL